MGFRGRQYRELVQEHMRKMGMRLELSMQGSVNAMLPHEKAIAEQIIDEINMEAHDQHFWTADCATTYDRITARFAVYLGNRGHKTTDSDAFNLFQLITMNLAATARDNKPLRVHAGIRKNFLIR